MFHSFQAELLTYIAIFVKMMPSRLQMLCDIHEHHFLYEFISENNPRKYTGKINYMIILTSHVVCDIGQQLKIAYFGGCSVCFIDKSGHIYIDILILIFFFII